ncbi:MAG: hypothetical protein ACRD4F_19080 [Candidatus Angelobacter sp.]
MERVRATLDDFPHFVVSEVVGTNLAGHFDSVKGVAAGRCWLLLPERHALIGDMEKFDAQTNFAIFNSADDCSHVVIGQKMPYLSGYWQAYHVWMILDDSPWDKVCFQVVDAVSESFTAEDGKSYRKLSKLKIGQELPTDALLVSGGWDHEHCELCNTHIDPADLAYTNADGLWVCVSCFENYVSPKNLSFVNDL